MRFGGVACRRLGTAALALGLSALALGASGALAAEPGWFSVSPEVNRHLILRKEPSARGKRVGEIPAGTRGIESRGCRGASDAAWDHLQDGIKAALDGERWCRIRWQGLEGWASARFLRPDSAPPEGEAPRAAPARPPALAARGSPRPDAPRSDASFIGTEWRVVSIGDLGVQDAAPWLRFTDAGELVGHTGCNRLRASFAAGTSALRISPPAVTRMACPEDAIFRQEHLFLAALELVEAQQVHFGTLRLLDAKGETRLLLRAVPR